VNLILIIFFSIKQNALLSSGLHWSDDCLTPN